MAKLLFKGDDGNQYLLDVNEGEVFTVDVIWDERLDGKADISSEQLGGYERSGDDLIFVGKKKDEEDAKKAEQARLDAEKKAQDEAEKEQSVVVLKNLSAIEDGPVKVVLSAIVKQLGIK